MSHKFELRPLDIQDKRNIIFLCNKFFGTHSWNLFLNSECYTFAIYFCKICNMKFLKYKNGRFNGAYYINNDLIISDDYFLRISKFSCNDFIIKNIIE